MKTILLMIILLSWPFTVALAGFEVPKHVYRMSDLDKALADARERNLPVTFVYSREDTSCGLCTHASTTVMDELRKRSVIIYAHSNNDWGTIPGIVQKALVSPEAGKFIPKTVVVKPDLSEIVAYIPYAQGKDFDYRIKAAEGLIREKVPQGSGDSAKSGATPPSPGASTATTEQARQMRVWKSASGAEVEARLLRRTGYTVVLEKADGAQLKINLQNLSEEDRSFVTTSGL